MLQSRLLTPRQLADILGIALPTLYKITSQDETLPRIYIRGGAMRFNPKEVRAWIKKQPRRRKNNGRAEQ